MHQVWLTVDEQCGAESRLMTVVISGK